MYFHFWIPYIHTHTHTYIYIYQSIYLSLYLYLSIYLSITLSIMHIYNSYIINSFPDGSLTKYQMEINFIIFGSMFGICLNHFSTVKSRNFATVNLWKYYGFLTEKIWRSFFFFFGQALSWGWLYIVYIIA